MSKHAYLIMAHSSFSELQYLLSMIDDARNDIFLHIDKKTNNVPMNELTNSVHHSRLFFTPRLNVVWGGSSQIDCEMLLFSEAARVSHYDYYHLISGVDVPVKSQDYIHDYCQRYRGLNFITSAQDGERGHDPAAIAMRYDQYHLLQNTLVGKKRNLAKYIDFASCYAQRAIGIHRGKNRVFHKSLNWVSLTDGCVRFLLSRQQDIRKTYRFTYCCDEVFIISEIWGTPLESTLAPQGNLRFIEWKQYSKHDSSPRPIEMGDLTTLESPDILFARKFVLPQCAPVIDAVKRSWNN
ncbi:beta-1,6-N-acetylglucosaminyltransferase [Bifidobacterium canis]|uniref:Peptide O-xylosyltransferase n=1 Tax=Bifidobacterium canis TaxID=2610880 RepID=A0A7K1J5F1_9BIFI|nr:beta-1,6-N-acetylglucosaminyltransferase [Bifidobacterium canis]MUH59883.1 glycosyl transferase [Bifidobacterium canis]